MITDTRGTSVVEMALITPFAAMLVLGTVDASRAVSEKLKLQQAAARTVEMASAGGMNSAGFGSLQAEAAAAGEVPISSVFVDNWLECDRVRQPSFDGSCTSAEEVARYASVRLRKTYAPWFTSSLAGLGYPISRAITLEGKSSVRLQ